MIRPAPDQRLPHSCSTTCATRAGVAFGNAPSQLPSQIDHTIRQDEAVAERREFVRVIQCFDIVACHRWLGSVVVPAKAGTQGS